MEQCLSRVDFLLVQIGKEFRCLSMISSNSVSTNHITDAVHKSDPYLDITDSVGKNDQYWNLTDAPKNNLYSDTTEAVGNNNPYLGQGGVQMGLDSAGKGHNHSVQADFKKEVRTLAHFLQDRKGISRITGICQETHVKVKDRILVDQKDISIITGICEEIRVKVKEIYFLHQGNSQTVLMD